MTWQAAHLTNNAYSRRRVQPVAIACVHITGNSKTAAYADPRKAAWAERNYANRAGSRGPSAHWYGARDGFALMGVDPDKYVAWSNGDVEQPNTANAGIRRVLALKAKGYNANEAYWEEFEGVGFGTQFPYTDAQKQFVAERIAARHLTSGLPISRETVHGHWEINGVDRKNCPISYAMREAFLKELIARAKLIVAKDGDTMVKFKRVDNVGGTIVVKTATGAIPFEGGTRPKVAVGIKRSVLGSATLTDLDNRLCYIMWVGEQLCFIAASAVDFTPYVPTSPADCTDEVKAAILATKASARVVFG